MKLRDVETRILYRNSINSPLGRISMAGYIRNSVGVTNKPMRILGSYALVYLLEGGGHYEDARGHRQAVRPGDLILIFPTLGHAYGPRENQTWTEIYAIFDGPAFDLWERAGLLDPSRPIHHLEPISYWMNRFESAIGAPREPAAASPLMDVCRLQQALGEALGGGARGPAHQEDTRWLTRACSLLESDLSDDADLPRLVKRMGMGYESFRKRFVRLMGMPPKRYRATRIADRACELMQQASLPDKQIARQLGFCDEFHFSRRFRQMVGCSPREFRKRLLRAG